MHLYITPTLLCVKIYLDALNCAFFYILSIFLYFIDFYCWSDDLGHFVPLSRAIWPCCDYIVSTRRGCAKGLGGAEALPCFKLSPPVFSEINFFSEIRVSSGFASLKCNLRRIVT